MSIDRPMPSSAPSSVRSSVPSSVPSAAPPSGRLAPAPARAPGARRLLRASGTALAVAALGLGSATAAAAHVHVYPDTTAAGARSVLTFRVPTESATASTSGLTVDLPLDTPLLSVSTKPLAGWTVEVKTATLPEPVEVDGTTLTTAPSQVVWTAQPGAEIGPGQYQEFVVQAGPLPAAGTDVVLPAHQTYTDGTVVDWDEVAAAGADEPEHPAPVLEVTEASDAGHGSTGHGGGGAEHGSDAAGDDVTGAATDDGAAGADDPASGTDGAGADEPGSDQADAGETAGGQGVDPVARVTGVAGLALGAAGFVVALLAARRRASA